MRNSTILSAIAGPYRMQQRMAGSLPDCQLKEQQIWNVLGLASEHPVSVIQRR